MNDPARSPLSVNEAGTARSRAPAAGRGRLFLGVDLGKVTTCLAVGELSGDGELRVVETRAARHLGDPLRPFFELYATLDVARLAGLAVHTGRGDPGKPGQVELPVEIQERSQRVPQVAFSARLDDAQLAVE